MSVADTWASTLPSLYSIIACTVDCGWITTSTSDGAKPNSQQASITSKPLFISVAQSIVMRLPIRQVGCFRACWGVTNASASLGVLRKGPPEAVRMSFETCCRLPARRHWCAQALVRAVVFAIHRQQLSLMFPDGVHHQLASGHQHFLISQPHSFPQTYRLIGRFQAGYTDNRRDHGVHFAGGGGLNAGGASTKQFRPLRARQTGLNQPV